MVNSVILVGNLGNNPQIKENGDGSRVCTFQIATHKYFAKKQETKTVWHNIKLWNQQAESAMKMLKKGDLITIQGEIENDVYKDNAGDPKIFSWVVGSFKLISKGKVTEDEKI